MIVFNERQILAIQLSERIMSVLSIIGSIFIITTFWKWHYFRKPINRLVFYASFGNMTVNVATLIGTAAVPVFPAKFSPLCEFQGIIIQWFMAADSLWVFCMALNVQLVFFRGYNSTQLRHLEKWYLLGAYGVTGIVAVTYIFLDHFGSRIIIGPATLWCWVSAEVDWMRIAFFYAPVWGVIFSTMAIYIVTGWKIFRKGSELHSLSKRVAADQDLGNAPHSPHISTDLGIIKVETTMEVETTQPQDSWDPQAASPTLHNASRSSFGSTKQLSSNVETPAPTHIQPNPHSRRIHHTANTPSGYRATAFATNPMREPDVEPSRSMSITNNNNTARRHNGMKVNAAALGYFKVAFLMFAALVCVWVPSTANRLQQFIHKDHPMFGLNLASALVLPLQGFWNSMIYISTTWPECKRAIAELMNKDNGHKSEEPSWQPRGHRNLIAKPPELDTAILLETVETSAPISQQHLSNASSVEDVQRVPSEHKR
ncbi:hypothetical protein CC80DRAFT_24250 [Byssothecium circinans]|uniref:G-protein coupled receptors family 2 profile 2 domain-containing protein n=1 Tax=Byssothecium circinans TaxID=147558 RepID=A0A6A5TC30_9PLEO|nr:hypothetical protein CC80DRAFT_317929 [Byssothecium circinans]KAF1959012.1 hypothetical protein CC80DRAFT_24250 [Byssothecium circinans]